MKSTGDSESRARRFLPQPHAGAGRAVGLLRACSARTPATNVRTLPAPQVRWRRRSRDTTLTTSTGAGTGADTGTGAGTGVPVVALAVYRRYIRIIQ